MYHICVELRHRSIERQLTHGELAREAGDLLDMWEKRVTEGKPVPPVRRVIAAPAAEHGPTPIQLLQAKYNRNKSNGKCEMTLTFYKKMQASLRNNQAQTTSTTLLDYG
jgi:hypothetical protein